ncbi:MAG: 30S ribosomal protein S7 [Bacteroidia bacterium]|nr:MAG: 30S ribosomal protein S7 [Bacteroidia bacterium]
MRNQKKRKFGVQADPRFNDKMVTQFVNNLMLDGKKNVAFNIFYGALEIIDTRRKDIEETPLEIWKKAIANVTPQVEVKSRRVGGATFQVPMEITPKRKMSISMKNMIKFARQRKGKSMSEKLAAEIMDAFKEEGGAYKRKEEIHRMADANKAFAHFRF